MQKRIPRSKTRPPEYLAQSAGSPTDLQICDQSSFDPSGAVVSQGVERAVGSGSHHHIHDSRHERLVGNIAHTSVDETSNALSGIIAIPASRERLVDHSEAQSTTDLGAFELCDLQVADSTEDRRLHPQNTEMNKRSTWLERPIDRASPVSLTTVTAADCYEAVDDWSRPFEEGSMLSGPTDDGIFAPGSVYQSLHNTLRTCSFWTANSVQASRQVSPVDGLDVQHVTQRFQIPKEISNALGQSTTSSQGTRGEGILDAEQEHLLWRVWIEEVSGWVSACDTRLAVSTQV